MEIKLGPVKAFRFNARVDPDGDYSTRELTIILEPDAAQLSELVQAMSRSVHFWVALEGEEVQLPLDKALGKLEKA